MLAEKSDALEEATREHQGIRSVQQLPSKSNTPRETVSDSAGDSHKRSAGLWRQSLVKPGMTYNQNAQQDQRQQVVQQRQNVCTQSTNNKDYPSGLEFKRGTQQSHCQRVFQRQPAFMKISQTPNRRRLTSPYRIKSASKLHLRPMSIRRAVSAKSLRISRGFNML